MNAPAAPTVREIIATSPKLDDRWRHALLAKPDALLEAIVAVGREHPTWTASEVHGHLCDKGWHDLAYYAVVRVRYAVGEWRAVRPERDERGRYAGATDGPEGSLAAIWQPPIARLMQEPEHIRRAALEQWKRLAETDG